MNNSTENDLICKFYHIRFGTGKTSGCYNRPQITVCVAKTASGEFYRGLSICHPNDMPRKATGRAKALGRIKQEISRLNKVGYLAEETEEQTIITLPVINMIFYSYYTAEPKEVDGKVRYLLKDIPIQDKHVIFNSHTTRPDLVSMSRRCTTLTEYEKRIFKIKDEVVEESIDESPEEACCSTVESCGNCAKQEV